LREDASPLVRGHAAWALGEIGGEAAEAALKEALEEEPDERCKEEIEHALGVSMGRRKEAPGGLFIG
jgi:epoxyqueuosine reductase